MHISTSTGPTRPHHPGRPQPAPPRADPGPGPRPPARKAQWAHGDALLLGPPACAWTTYVPLDHLSAVGPPGSRNTVVQRNSSGPTAFKWSKQTEGVTTCETPSHHARQPATAGHRNRPVVARADPDGRPRPIPPHPTAPNTPGGDSSRPSRTTPHPRIPAASNDPAHHTRKTRSDTPRNNLPLRRGAAPCAGWALTRTPGGDPTWTTPTPPPIRPRPDSRRRTESAAGRRTGGASARKSFHGPGRHRGVDVIGAPNSPLDANPCHGLSIQY